MEELLRGPAGVWAVTGGPGVGKSTRFPLTLADPSGNRVIVVTPTVIGATVLSNFVSPDKRDDIRGRLSYISLEKYYSLLLSHPEKADADFICIDDVQLAKLEQTLLFLVLRSRMASRKVILLGIDVPSIYSTLHGKQFPELEIKKDLFDIITAYLDSTPIGAHKIEACIRELRQLLPIRKGSALLIVRYHDIEQYVAALKEQFPEEKVYAVTADSYESNVFEEKRIVIVSTPIMETTVTIPDLEIIVDSMETDLPRSRGNGELGRSRKSWISGLQAAQRRGRVGRTRPGTCLRLCTEEFVETLPLHYPVELELLNLAVPQLRLHLHGLADLIPKHLDARVELEMLDLLDLGNPQNRQVAELMVRLPLELIPGFLASRWVNDGRSFRNGNPAEEMSAMILYIALVEVEGPYLRPLDIQSTASLEKLKDWAAPSDFHSILRIVEDIKFPTEKWVNPNGLLEPENWKEVRVLIRELYRHFSDVEMMMVSQNIPIYTYLPRFQEVAYQALPVAVYTYDDSLSVWRQAKGDREYVPNNIYPEKRKSPVQVALAIRGDVIILGLGLD